MMHFTYVSYNNEADMILILSLHTSGIANKLMPWPPQVVDPILTRSVGGCHVIITTRQFCITGS